MPEASLVESWYTCCKDSKLRLSASFHACILESVYSRGWVAAWICLCIPETSLSNSDWRYKISWCHNSKTWPMLCSCSNSLQDNPIYTILQHVTLPIQYFWSRCILYYCCYILFDILQDITSCYHDPYCKMTLICKRLKPLAILNDSHIMLQACGSVLTYSTIE